MPEDINTILETVSKTQSGVKVVPSHIPERKFRDVKELLQFLSSVTL